MPKRDPQATKALKLAKLNSHRSAPFVYNADIGLIKWKAALAKLKAGEQKIYNVPVLGDSISEGGYAGGGAGGGTSSQFPTKGYVGRIRSTLAGKFGDVGSGFAPYYYPNGSPLWTFTGSWSDSQNFVGATGRAKQSTTAGGTATFTFSGTGVGIVVTKGSASGTMNVSIDGGSATSYDLNPGYYKNAEAIEITGLTDGNHTLTITSTVTAGKNIWLHGAYPIKGNSGIRIHMCGRWGTIASTSAIDQAMYTEIDMWNPPLTIIAFTANDYTVGTPLATYQSSLETMIARAKTFGDVLLVSTGLRTEAPPIGVKQSEYANIQLQLAIKYNCAYVDIFNRWSGDATYAKDTLGFLYDAVHPNDYGHQDIATAVLNVLLEPSV